MSSTLISILPGRAGSNLFPPRRHLTTTTVQTLRQDFWHRRRISTVALVVFVFSLCTSLSLHAHEYWLAPLASTVDVGETLALDIRNGENFGGRAFPCVAHKVRSIKIYGPDGVDDSHCRDGAFPAIKVRTTTSGIYTIYIESTERHVTYGSLEKFSEFLEYNGLSEKLSEHRARQLPDNGIKERFYRFAKAIVAVGNKGISRKFDAGEITTTSDFELQMLSNPFSGATELEVLLVRQGEPVSDHQITLFHRDGDLISRTLYTSDDRGAVTIKADAEGKYLLNAVFMKEPKQSDVHWETQWTSLTFAK